MTASVLACCRASALVFATIAALVFLPATAAHAAQQSRVETARAFLCPAQVRRVCARLKGRKITYRNACMARKAGARILADGVCNVVICPRIYRPVCAERDGIRRTYGNGCSARGFGARIIHRGRCAPKACTRDYRPVCAIKAGVWLTYPNVCMARAARARIIADGACR